MASNRFIYYILAVFLAGNFLLIYIQYNSARNINQLSESNEKLLHEFRIESELRDLRRNITSVETRIRQAIAVQDTKHIPDLRQQIGAIEANLYKLQKIDDNDSAEEYIDQLDSLVHEKISYNSRALDLFYTSNSIDSGFLHGLGREKSLTDSIAGITHKIDSTRRYMLTQVTARADKSGRDARRWGTVLFVLTMIGGAAFFWFIINRVRRQNQLILQLNESEKKVLENAKLKENFMANMSHEIRTPLNAILGFASLLAKKQLDADATLYAQSIKNAGDNLLHIVSDILDLSKLEAGMLQLEVLPFDLRSMLHSVEMMFYEKAKEKGLQLSFRVEEAVPELLEGDATRLTQILVNLVSNAVKFTDNGFVAIEARNAGIVDNGIKLSLQVRDTGIGIEKDKLSGVFDRFKQAELSITRKYGGTGLGLAIVKDLVLLQKGTIDAESTPGTGSAFTIVIPYKIPGTQTQRNDELLSEPQTVFPGRKVLVVEDNEINQNLMKHLLAQWQLFPVIKGSGKAALEVLQLESFDLIFMDIQMPEMDGYTAAQKIRQELKLNTPVIAMTAHALPGERDKCIGYGMNEYLAKPITEKALLNNLTRFLPNTNEKATLSKPEQKIYSGYKCINLQYLQEISNGNTDYEKQVTQLFIETVPEDLFTIETSLQNQHYAALRHTAHDMKTTVSVMGLNQKLQPILDALEDILTPEHTLVQYYHQLQNICEEALEEAKTFYASL